MTPGAGLAEGVMVTAAWQSSRQTWPHSRLRHWMYARVTVALTRSDVRVFVFLLLQCGQWNCIDRSIGTVRKIARLSLRLVVNVHNLAHVDPTARDYCSAYY